MWIAYIIRQFDKEMDPLKTVTLLEVINWTAEAWNHYVRPLTIERCWWKSTVVIKPPSPVEDLEWFDVDGLGHADRSHCTPETRSATYDREHQQDLIELYNQINNTHPSQSKYQSVYAALHSS